MKIGYMYRIGNSVMTVTSNKSTMLKDIADFGKNEPEFIKEFVETPLVEELSLPLKNKWVCFDNSDIVVRRCIIKD